MAIANFDTREIILKIVYFGSLGSGKSTNLRSLFRSISPEIKSGLFELDSGNKTGFYFVPVSIGYVSDFHIKVHAYSFGGIDAANCASAIATFGMDGAVFVFDSRVDSLVKSLECFENLKSLIMRSEDNLASYPLVVQFNHLDHASAIPSKILQDECLPAGVLSVDAVATRSEGVAATFERVVALALKRLEFRPESENLMQGQL